MLKKIWIIGCSNGIGLELAKLFLKNNYLVIGSARNIENSKELNKLKLVYNERLKLLNVDVSNEQEVQECVEEIFNKYDTLDICFYNAGIYEKNDIFNTNLNDFENIININYLGAVRVLKYLLNFLKKQNESKIVLNASLSSYFGLPYASSYGSSKAALVNFAQSIQPELLRENIKLQIINHGFVKTRLTAKNDFEMPQLMESSFAAKKIYKQLHKPYKFEIRFPFILSKFLQLLNLLPYNISLKITKRFLK